MHNYKFICLHCLRSQKGQGSCCGWPLYGIGYKARAPKKTASKSEWKQFIDLFVNGSQTRGQLKRIIALRKEYGLPTLSQETALAKMEEVHEERFTIIDIKHHERLVEMNAWFWGDEEKSEKAKFVKSLNELINHFRMYAIAEPNLKHNTEYFVFPYHATPNSSNFVFPLNEGRFEILKVRAQNSRQPHSNKFDLFVKTNNTNECINEYIQGQQRYAYRQNYLIFDDKLKAAAFRQEYLTMVFPLLKEHGATYLKDIVNKVKVDYDRVMKKAPQLLV